MIFAKCGGHLDTDKYKNRMKVEETLILLNAERIGG